MTNRALAWVRSLSTQVYQPGLRSYAWGCARVRHARNAIRTQRLGESQLISLRGYVT